MDLDEIYKVEKEKYELDLEALKEEFERDEDMQRRELERYRQQLEEEMQEKVLEIETENSYKIEQERVRYHSFRNFNLSFTDFYLDGP